MIELCYVGAIIEHFHDSTESSISHYPSTWIKSNSLYAAAQDALTLTKESAHLKDAEWVK